MKVWKDRSGKWIDRKEFTNRFKTGVQQISPMQQIKVSMFGYLIIYAGIIFGLVSTYKVELWWLFTILCGSGIISLIQGLGMLQKYLIYKNLEKEVDNETKTIESE